VEGQKGPQQRALEFGLRAVALIQRTKQKCSVRQCPSGYCRQRSKASWRWK